MMGDRAIEDIVLAQDALLKHPLTISTDVRLVSVCQLFCIHCKGRFRWCGRTGAHVPPTAQIQQRLGFGRDEKFNEKYIIDVLRDAHSQMDAWQSEWDLVMSAFWTGVSLLILISLSRCAPWGIWLLSFLRGDSARICKPVSQ
jgi:hypothetical protein